MSAPAEFRVCWNKGAQNSAATQVMHMCADKGVQKGDRHWAHSCSTEVIKDQASRPEEGH